MAFVVASVISTLTADAQNKVLFIGNSFTEGTGGVGAIPAGGIPGIFDAMAQAGGQLDPLTVMRTEGGVDFEFHNGDATTQTTITSDQWTHVVLQNYSTEPTHLDVGSVDDHLAFGLGLGDQILANNPGTQVILFETWSRGSGNALITGTTSGTSFSSTAEFQEELRSNYGLLADVIDFMNPSAPFVRVGSVGDGFEIAGGLLPDDDPNYLDLLDDIGYHANDNGSYLAAAVFYSTIYGVSAEGLSTEPEIAALNLSLTVPASLLESIAWSIVTDGVEPEEPAFLIDFGNPNPTAMGPSPNDPANFWNNVTFAIGTSGSGQLNGLVTVLGTPTAVGLRILTPFGGANGNGTQTSSVFPINATRDTLFASNSSASFKLTGLNPSSVYGFTFYASRDGVTDNREARYTVTGATSGSAVLNASGNVDGTTGVFGIAPDDSLEISIEVSATENNDNPDQFIYLGVLRVNAASSDIDPVVIGSQPVGQNVLEFATANFSATASGTPPFSIQWKRNGVAIAGANQLTYSIAGVDSALNGSVYTVTITNAVSSVTSAPAVLTVVPTPTEPYRFLVDFGNNGTPTGNGESPDDPDFFWNNLTITVGNTASGGLSNLVTDENTVTSGRLTMLSRFNGGNASGTTVSSLFPIDATRDSLVGNTEFFGGLTNIFPAFKLDGLSPGWIYHFTFYASREGVADNRTARYTVAGLTSDFDELNASNNVDDTAYVPGIIPAEGGSIQVNITPSAANNNANHFTYLGAMVVDAEPIPGAPVITSEANANGTVGDPFSYAITATNSPILFGASPLPPGLAVDSGSGIISGTPSVAGQTVVVLSAENFGGIGEKDLTLLIEDPLPDPPVITSEAVANGTVGVPFSYAITATNSPTQFDATPLPSGLSVDSVSGIISGTPTVAGQTVVALSAVNAGGTGEKDLTLVFAEPIPGLPVITSEAIANGTVGVPFSYAITATNSPTQFDATPLPSGLSVDSVSGIISGTPTVAGQTVVALSAVNAGGTGEKDLTLVIEEPGTGLGDAPLMFFGDFGSEAAGTFGLLVRTDLTGVFLAVLPDSETCIDSPAFTVAENGSFSFPAEGLGTLSGQITGDAVSGTINGSPLAFSGTLDQPGGTTQSVAGLYQAAVVNSFGDEFQILAGSDGRAFVLACGNGQANGASAVIGSGNTINDTLTNGETVAFTLNATTGIVSGTVTSQGGTMSVSGALQSAPVSKLLNSLSVRAQVIQDDEILIAGFSIKGTGTKRVLIRGVGPTLSEHQVPNPLADPQITLIGHVGTVDTVLNQNDDWGLASNASEIDTVSKALFAFDLPADSKDSVILVDLPAGRYSALVSGVGGQTGTTLVEIYDGDTLLSGPPATQLGSISTRGVTGVDDNVVIAGFAVTGNVPKRVLVRAVGLELAPLGVTGALADPVLDLVRQDGPNAGLIASNDDWGSDAAAIIEAGDSVFAFPLDAGSTSSAIVIWLAPGQYTALASSGDETTGVSLVEVYELP